MAQGEGFKHITVTAAEEDDVVIMAGAVSAAEPAVQPREGAEIAAHAAERAEQKPMEAESASSAEAPDAIEAAAVAEPASAEPEEAATAEPAPAPASPVRTVQASRQDEPRETTLEDLESTPMPFAQRVVIIAAIALIAIALVYYFVFMA